MSTTEKRSGDLQPTRGQTVPSDDARSQALSEALGSSFILVRILVFVLIGAFLLSCVFTVNPNEVAVVLRFGKPVGTGPEVLKRQGLHWAFPYPIDEVVKIRNAEALSASTRTPWYQISEADEAQRVKPSYRDRLSPQDDGHVLMSDGNILHAKATVRYRILDPITYSFKFNSVSNLLANALNNALYHAAATFKADAALYKDREGFRQAVRDYLEKWIIKAELGIAIEVLDVQTAAPLHIEDAFDNVIKAEQARSAEVSKARGDADEITRKAVGTAESILARGQISSNALMQSVTADADSFSKLRADYHRNPELFRARLLTESFGRILTNATDKFFASPDELRLLISKEPIVPQKPSEPGAATQ